MKKFDIILAYDKIKKTFESCTYLEQLDNAYRMAHRFEKYCRMYYHREKVQIYIDSLEEIYRKLSFDLDYKSIKDLKDGKPK